MFKNKKRLGTHTHAHRNMDLREMYGTSLSTAAVYPFFSSTLGKCSRIDHILGQNTTHSKIKKMEIIPSIFSDHKGMKIEINKMRKLEI